MKNTTYEEAFEELQAIVKEIGNRHNQSRPLKRKRKRAGELIRICKEKLFKTEQEVNEVLKNIER